MTGLLLLVIGCGRALKQGAVVWLSVSRWIGCRRLVPLLNAPLNWWNMEGLAGADRGVKPAISRI